MSKYNGWHFSPLNNRGMLMPRIPKNEEFKQGPRGIRPSYPPVDKERIDPEHPYFQVNTGLTEKTIEINGEERRYAIYVPQGMITKGMAAVVFPESGVSGREFIESSNWKELSEKNHMAYFVFEAEKWNIENVEKEFDFAHTVIDKEFQQRLTVDVCESYFYPIGLGDGAYVCTAFALTYSATFPSFAADGNCAVDPQLFEVLRSLPSDGIDTWKKNEIAMPGFLIDRSGNAGETVAYMKEILRAKEEGLHNAYGEVSLEKSRRGAYFINEQPVAQSWFATDESVNSFTREELNEAMIGFVKRFSRWGTFGNQSERERRVYSDTCIRQEREIDGRKRFWDVYVPSCYRKEEDRKYPLVVAIHGMSCNADYFEMTSDWHRLAEERGFFVAFASAYPHNDGLCLFPVPHWALGSINSNDLTDEELHYFEVMLDSLETEYPIDTTRVYAVGHSNGSQMTQTLARRMPERFAAFGPTGSLAGWDPEKVPDVPENVGIPIWFMMGQYDIVGADTSEGSIARATLNSYCRANNMEPAYDNWYDNGRYHTLVMYDREHVPMVRYTQIQGAPHTYTPEMAQLTWDTFLCHFSRDENGKTVYKG